LFVFRTNLTSMSMITEIISAIPQPSTLTATIPVVPDCLQLVGPCKLDLKEIICLYFSDGIWNCLSYMSFLFSQKNIAKQRQKIVLTRQPSTLTATTPVVPNWWTPTNWTLRKLFVYFSDGTWNWIIRLFCSFSKT
jgi:hypothetical protein